MFCNSGCSRRKRGKCGFPDPPILFLGFSLHVLFCDFPCFFFVRFQKLSSLTLQPLFLKARVFPFAEPLKSLEKKGKTPKKSKEIRTTKKGNEIEKKQGLEGQGFPRIVICKGSAERRILFFLGSSLFEQESRDWRVRASLFPLLGLPTPNRRAKGPLLHPSLLSPFFHHSSTLTSLTFPQCFPPPFSLISPRVARRTLKTEKLLSSSPSRKSALRKERLLRGADDWPPNLP